MNQIQSELGVTGDCSPNLVTTRDNMITITEAFDHSPYGLSRCDCIMVLAQTYAGNKISDGMPYMMVSARSKGNDEDFVKMFRCLFNIHPELKDAVLEALYL